MESLFFFWESSKKLPLTRVLVNQDLSQQGGLKKGNIQSHDFMLKKSGKVLNPWDFSQRNTYTYIIYIYILSQNAWRKTRARSFWHQILIALWRMTQKKPRMSMFLGKADVYIQVCPPCRNYPTTSVVIYDIYIYIYSLTSFCKQVNQKKSWLQ